MQNEPSGLTYWPQPKAIRNYYGLNLSLEKRFSHNWQGAINYTLSLTKGNYGGLSSTDEFGRNSPNVERSFDLWFMAYQMDGTPVNGTLPQDRTHYIKAYGSYTFPMGLTLGFAAYGRSGNPISTRLNFNNSYIYPYGYGDLGRLPFTFWADLYLDYSLKLGGKYRLSFNFQINNATNTRTIQSHEMHLNLDGIYATNAQILDGTLANTYQAMVAKAGDTNFAYNKWDTRFYPWSARLGAKFSF